MRWSLFGRRRRELLLKGDANDMMTRKESQFIGFTVLVYVKCKE